LSLVGRAFDLSRDPYIAKQLRDADKSEAKRREEQTGRGSGMVGRDQPKPVLRPAGKISRAVERQHFQNRWLAEQRDSVMARAAANQTRSDPSRTPLCAPKEPSR